MTRARADFAGRGARCASRARSLRRALAAGLLALALPACGREVVVDYGYSLEGTVADIVTRRPLEGVAIDHGFPELGIAFYPHSVTDASGRFEEHALGPIRPSGVYRFRKEGYRTLDVSGLTAVEAQPGHYALTVLLLREEPASPPPSAGGDPAGRR